MKTKPTTPTKRKHKKRSISQTLVNLSNVFIKWFEGASQETQGWKAPAETIKGITINMCFHKPIKKNSDFIRIQRHDSNYHIILRNEKIHIGTLVYNVQNKAYELYLVNEPVRSNEKSEQHNAKYLCLVVRRAIIMALSNIGIKAGGYTKKTSTCIEYAGLKTYFGLVATALGKHADFEKWLVKSRLALMAFISEVSKTQTKQRDKRRKELAEQSLADLTTLRKQLQ